MGTEPMEGAYFYIELHNNINSYVLFIIAKESRSRKDAQIWYNWKMFEHPIMTTKLTRGPLLSTNESQAKIFTADYGGRSIIIKRALPNQPGSIEEEKKFLDEHKGLELTTSCEELGIHLPGWKVQTRFVKPIEIEGDQLLKNEIALERAVGETFVSDEVEASESVKRNNTIPKKFQVAGIMGYLNILRHLQSTEGIVLDSNIDKELFIDFDPNSKTISVTKVDCMVMNAEDKSGLNFPGGAPEKWKPHLDGIFMKKKHEVAWQLAVNIKNLFKDESNQSDLFRLFSDLFTAFKVAQFTDPISMYSYLQDGLKRVNWLNLLDVYEDNDRYEYLLRKKGLPSEDYYLGHLPATPKRLKAAITKGEAFALVGDVSREFANGDLDFKAYNPTSVDRLADKTLLWEGLRTTLQAGKKYNQETVIGSFITTSGGGPVNDQTEGVDVTFQFDPTTIKQRPEVTVIPRKVTT